eukprot:CAMPEP_0181081194 /NCGR_PEP_ID=MMETSP1071-20121207/2973_1 /TAXON_ID=35127 /ORGANISM="Thalassiosira sp., Strain NH16" /LENGTH=110 /DNA_ID=CAMNT_0023162727 /DNA_START=903 /DNA_END=1235 /DNA_ORIENTATION=+
MASSPSRNPPIPANSSAKVNSVTVNGDAIVLPPPIESTTWLLFLFAVADAADRTTTLPTFGKLAFFRLLLTAWWVLGRRNPGTYTPLFRFKNSVSSGWPSSSAAATFGAR